MARPSKDYKEYLHQRLRNPAEAAEYINGALEGDDIPGLLLALRDVAEARGIGPVAARAGLNRENVYRILSEEGNPRVSSLFPLLRALGIEVQAKPLRPALIHKAPISMTVTSNLGSEEMVAAMIPRVSDSRIEGRDYESSDQTDEQSRAA